MNVMKKFLLLVISILMFAPFMKAQTGGGDPTEIIIVGEGGSGEGTPSHKASVPVPITAAYNASLSTIMVNFLFDLGYVSVEIENQTTGEYDQTVVNAQEGPMLFPISGTAGQWAITFTLPGGVVLNGYFVN